MIPIKALRVDPIDVAHALGQIACRGLDYQMIVVRHQTVGITHPLHPTADLLQDLEESLSVTMVQVNIRPAIAKGGNMVQGTWKFYAQWASHRAKYKGVMWQCKT
jgi:hypothetical protein